MLDFTGRDAEGLGSHLRVDGASILLTKQTVVFGSKRLSIQGRPTLQGLDVLAKVTDKGPGSEPSSVVKSPSVLALEHVGLGRD